MAKKVVESPIPKAPVPATSGPLAEFEAWLYEMLVVKAPFQLPKGLTDFIVQYCPWITLGIGILCLPAIFAVLSLGTAFGGYFNEYGSFTVFYWLGLMALVAQVALMFVAVPMLLRRERNGWLLLFYADLLSFGYSVLTSLTFGYYFTVGNILAALLGLVIGLYILFQIRGYYVK